MNKKISSLCTVLLIPLVLLASCDPASFSTVYVYNKSSHDIRLSVSTRFNRIEDLNISIDEIKKFDAPAALGTRSISPAKTLDKIVIYDATTNEALREFTSIEEILRLLKVEKNSVGAEQSDYIVLITDDILLRQ